MSRKDAPGHVPILDGVRGLAVLMVLFCHLMGPMPETGLVSRLVRHVVSYSALGVDVFFLLSGYLITGILLRSRGDEHYYRNFYARRVLRIFPLYYATLALVLIVAPALSAYARQELAPTLLHQGWAWLYVVNFFYLFHPGADFRYLAHFWSLAVEEHFYLLWPLLVRALSPRGLGRACLLVAIGTSLAHLAAPFVGIDPVAATMVTPLRVDTLCLGALLGVWHFQGRDRRSMAATAAITGAAALAASVLTVVAQRLAPSLTEIARGLRGIGTHVLLWAAFAGLLASRPGALTQRVFRSSVLRFFGKYSYGIYVIHAIVGLAAFRAHTVERLAARVGSFSLALVIVAAAVVVISVLTAMASYRFLESPFLVLKARFAPRHTPITDPAPASAPEPPVTTNPVSA